MIKFAKLVFQNEEYFEIVRKICSEASFLKGQYNREFSGDWARYNGATYCTLTSSGTMALYTVLRSLVSRDKPFKIIIPDLSYSASIDSVLEAGIEPVFCKVLPNGLIDQQHCIELLAQDPNIVAVMVVHLYGQRVEIDEKILQQALVIEDACQVHGGLERIQGHAACFSFYPSKNLGTVGDGGAIVTNIPGLANQVEKFVNCGDAFHEKYIHSVVGLNARMDEIKAAHLSLTLKDLKGNNRKRQDIALKYHQGGIKTFVNLGNNVFHLYPILVNDPIKFSYLMKEKGIETGHHYPYTLSSLRGQKIQSDTADRIANHNVTLPMGPHLSEKDVSFVISMFHEVMGDNLEVFQL